MWLYVHRVCLRILYLQYLYEPNSRCEKHYETQANETAEAFDTSFCVFNLNDLYPSYEIAVKAMNIEVSTKK